MIIIIKLAKNCINSCYNSPLLLNSKCVYKGVHLRCMHRQGENNMLCIYLSIQLINYLFNNNKTTKFLETHNTINISLFIYLVYFIYLFIHLFMFSLKTWWSHSVKTSFQDVIKHITLQCIRLESKWENSSLYTCLLQLSVYTVYPLHDGAKMASVGKFVHPKVRSLAQARSLISM